MIRIEQVRWSKGFMGIQAVRMESIDTEDKGLLDEIPSVRLIRGVIIVEKRNKKRILELLKDFDAEVYVREVVLVRKDLKALGGE